MSNAAAVKRLQGAAAAAYKAGLTLSEAFHIVESAFGPGGKSAPLASGPKAPKRMVPQGELMGATHSTRAAIIDHKPTAWLRLCPNGGDGWSDAAEAIAWTGTPPTVGAILSHTPAHIRRVYLCGPRPGLNGPHSTNAENVRAWYTATLPPAWHHGTHWLGNDESPVGNYRHESGRTLEVCRAATWLGEDSYAPGVAAQAMHYVDQLLRQHFGQGYLSSPAATGRQLWRLTIPAGKKIPHLAEDVRDLLHHTSGQGRIEFFRPKGPEIPGLWYLDGRLMYAALTYGMPVGHPQRLTGAGVAGMTKDEYTRLLRGRAWFHVRVSIPREWDHVGILPLKDSDGVKWHYPSEGGRTFTTWAGGAEIWLAAENGWQVEILEGLTWREGKPLDTWAGRLKEAWAQAGALDKGPVGPLAQNAIRSIILHGIGVFATRRHDVTRAVSIDNKGQIPAGAQVSRVGETLVWREKADLGTWATPHVEYAVTIWSRARARLLRGLGGVGGALSVPRATVLGMRTDALYLTSDPGWPDDGKPGTFRVKGCLARILPAPESDADLLTLRDGAVAAHEQ